MQHDPQIMASLLNEKGVRDNVSKMTADELAMFTVLLIKRGIYARYVIEQQRKEYKNLWQQLKNIFKRGK